MKLSTPSTILRIGFAYALLQCLFSPLAAQTDSIPRVFSIDAEYRPRAEYRNGFMRPRTGSETPGFAISHRARLNVSFSSEKLDYHFSVQDIRLWGAEDTRNSAGQLQLFQAWVEPVLAKGLSVRIGRQTISYDNERLFARNNWRQTAGKHDAVRFIWKHKEKLTADLIGAYNQTSQSLFGQDYVPDFDFYKVLVANFVEFKHEKWLFRAINFSDGYQDTSRTGVVNFKFTHGGRIERNFNKHLLMSGAGYYQYGRLADGMKHSAWYAEGHAKVTLGKYRLEPGVAILSGTSATEPANSSRSFLAQYGAFHAHNGRMDYTAIQVRTPRHAGLVNVFLLQRYKLTQRLDVALESHVLATQATQRVLTSNGLEDVPPIWGYENDFRAIYAPNDWVHIEAAYMMLVPTESMESLMGGSASFLNHFAYLELTFTPQLLQLKFKPNSWELMRS